MCTLSAILVFVQTDQKSIKIYWPVSVRFVLEDRFGSVEKYNHQRLNRKFGSVVPEPSECSPLFIISTLRFIMLSNKDKKVGWEKIKNKKDIKRPSILNFNINSKYFLHLYPMIVMILNKTCSPCPWLVLCKLYINYCVVKTK